MLLVDTTVKPSGIHGLGCFANEFIKAGTRVWVFDRRIDCVIKESRLSRLPKSAQLCVDFYCYVTTRMGGRYYVICGDNSRHMNHSDHPNIVDNVACRDVQIGEEMTCDYYAFDLDASKKLNGNRSSVTTGEPCAPAGERHWWQFIRPIVRLLGGS